MNKVKFVDVSRKRAISMKKTVQRTRAEEDLSLEQSQLDGHVVNKLKSIVARKGRRK